jgi:hypothetical protein
MRADADTGGGDMRDGHDTVVSFDRDDRRFPLACTAAPFHAARVCAISIMAENGFRSRRFRVFCKSFIPYLDGIPARAWPEREDEAMKRKLTTVGRDGRPVRLGPRPAAAGAETDAESGAEGIDSVERDLRALKAMFDRGLMSRKEYEERRAALMPGTGA